MSSLDFMISVKRARPKDKTEVLARIDKHITRLEYDNGFPMDGVKSWVWAPSDNCSCHKLRWEGTKSGTCKKCGTKWKKVLDKSRKRL